MFRSIPHQRYLAILGGLFAVVFALSAFRPHHPADWFLENALVVLGIVVLFALRQRMPFSRISYTLIFIFLCLHELGAHYTYAEVPYRDWFPALAHERNHFDRLVHFTYGLLLAYPIREIFLRVGNVRGFWGYFLPLDLTMSTSMLYELIEWGAAEFFGGELGQAYLGTQGDIWDGQWDMGLAVIGSAIAVACTAVAEKR